MTRSGSRVEGTPTWQARLSSLQFGVALVFAATFVLFCFWTRFPVPYGDDWDWLVARLERPPTIGSLFEPHNEHLIPLLRLLVALQYRIEGSGTHLIFALAMLAQVLIAWLCWREVRRRWPDPVTARLVGGVAGVLLFFSFQLQSFVFMAAALFPLVQMFATAAVVAALNASEHDPPRRRLGWTVAALASAGAAATTTNGLMVPVLVALIAWRRRQSGWVVTGFALAGSAAVLGYLIVMSRSGSAVAPATGAHWAVPPVGAMAAYFLTFFASGLAYVSVRAAVMLGTVLFAAGAYAIARIALARREPVRVELFAAALMLFAILSAAMATPARAQFGAIQAAQSRYATYAMVYWTALLFFVASRLDERAWRRLRPAVLPAALAISTAAFVLHVFIAMVWKAKADNIAAASLSLEAGVRDDEWIATLHPTIAVVYKGAEELRAAGDLRFTSPLIGTRLDDRPDLAACGGSLSLKNVSQRGHWRADGRLSTPVSTALIADRSGTVRGLAQVAPLVASPDPREPEVVRAVWQDLRRPRDELPEWIGFVGGGDGPPYTIYPLDDRGQPLCRTAVDVAEPVHAWLDGPSGSVSAMATAVGWAFQCGGGIERVVLLIDDVEQVPLEVEYGRPRSDVHDAFARLCTVNDAGFALTFDTRRLAGGEHQVKLRVLGQGGSTVDSNPQRIEVTR